jgi:hypothetical protein
VIGALALPAPPSAACLSNRALLGGRGCRCGVMGFGCGLALSVAIGVRATQRPERNDNPKRNWRESVDRASTIESVPTRNAKPQTVVSPRKSSRPSSKPSRRARGRARSTCAAKDRMSGRKPACVRRQPAEDLAGHAHRNGAPCLRRSTSESKIRAFSRSLSLFVYVRGERRAPSTTP